mmetsp:Transcript_9004/g.10533  ORF Transcript_9004/g.10533 Transcript_9004/m.10533 type:complete len:106 (-) Transcript_9004:124-441(-)
MVFWSQLCYGLFIGQTCGVSGYDKKIKWEEICIGIGLKLWSNPTTGQSQLLQVNQGLDMRHILDHTLANLNQCQSFGISWCDEKSSKYSCRAIGVSLIALTILHP